MNARQIDERLEQLQDQRAAFEERRLALQAELAEARFTGDNLEETISEKIALQAELDAMDSIAGDFAAVEKALHNEQDKLRVQAGRVAIAPIRERFADGLDRIQAALGEVQLAVDDLAEIRNEGTAATRDLADCELRAVWGGSDLAALKLLRGRVQTYRDRLRRTPWHPGPLPCEVEYEPPGPAPQPFGKAYGVKPLVLLDGWQDKRTLGDLIEKKGG
jgi:hypothetical protein